MEKTVLDLGREIEAIAKNGIAFSKDPFDLERFHQLETVAAGRARKTVSWCIF